MVGYRSTYARAHRSPPSHALVASGYSRATSPYTPILSRYPLSTSLHPFSLAATAAEVQLALARVPPIKARTLLFFHRAHNFPQQILRNGNRKHPRLIRYASKLSAYGWETSSIKKKVLFKSINCPASLPSLAASMTALALKTWKQIIASYFILRNLRIEIVN